MKKEAYSPQPYRIEDESNSTSKRQSWRPKPNNRNM